MTNAWLPVLALGTVLGLIGSVGCGAATAEDAQDVQNRLVSVNLLTPTATTMERTTTQPATVHAYYQTSVYAKVAGYLTDLRVDIGTPVKKGELLARIDIPEMAQQRAIKLVKIQQMLMNEQRAMAELAVAKAGEHSYQAKRDKVAAEVAQADAEVKAARAELDRVTDLVKREAVAGRLQDEAQKKYDAAAAAKTAAQAAVVSAKAELTLAEAQRDVERADLDVVKAATVVAERELDELDELIKYAQIVAPLDGIVIRRDAQPGDLVRNAQTGLSKNEQPLFVISQFDKVRVRVHVPERDVPAATVGDRVAITLQALPGAVFTGKISRIAGVLDEQSRTMLVEIDLPNAEGRMRPGMFGQARITLAPPGNTLTLPANAVHFDKDGNGYVYLLDAANKVAIAEVQTGLDDGAQIEITSGIKPDDRVVGPLLHRLKAGQTVHVN